MGYYLTFVQTGNVHSSTYNRRNPTRKDQRNVTYGMSKLFGHQLEQLTCLLKIRPSGLRICGLCAQECLISLKCQTARAVENGSNVSGHTQDYGNAISSLQNLGLLPPTRLRTYMPKVCWTLKTSLFFQFSRFAYKGSSFT